MQAAFEAMVALESGAIANPDEKRQVGHYWLRAPERAPSDAIRECIESTLTKIHAFAQNIHQGDIRGKHGLFQHLMLIGIGGSALGPQFVSQALGDPLRDKLSVHFLDNTDPDGIERLIAQLQDVLGQTLFLVISKSGTTPETRNGMLEMEAAYAKAGLKFADHAVAITGEGSTLDRHAIEAGWLERFPMWEWVGGRTSELAAVGLLPAALQGLPIDALLAGAREMDAVTRTPCTLKNPAALLALMWYHITEGKGTKDMVILPYKDRLELFSKYLQQLVMESLGKEKDVDDRVVHQGIAVYGNKGSTDQHAYVQQLREGVHNFFVTFIEVLKDRQGEAFEVEPDTTSGDFLHGFFLGTREALYENGRQSITLTIKEVSAGSIGRLIALFERAVGFYASLVNINAYHQPGVEAGKKAAATILDLKRKVLNCLRDEPGSLFTAGSMAQKLNLEPQCEFIFKILEHLAANPEKKVRKITREPFSESEYLYGQD